MLRLSYVTRGELFLEPQTWHVGGHSLRVHPVILSTPH